MDRIRRNLLLGVGLGAGLPGAASPAGAGLAADPTEVIDLWPAGPPGGVPAGLVQTLEERPNAAGLRDRVVSHVSRPTLTVFRPSRPNGAAVLLAPGGGYERVVIDKEGFETARWLAERGTTAFVLLYRLPGDAWAAGPDAPLQDAQRALRLVRGRAAAMGFDPGRVGIQGFSAGGHLAASLATRFDVPVYAPVDGVDANSARPDFACLCYPVITMDATLAHKGSRRFLLGPNPTQAATALYSAETGVTPTCCPTFLVAAADDHVVPLENTLMMFASLKRAGVRVEMHIFEEGGHGFGLRAIAGKPVGAWPELFRAWGVRHGMFDTPPQGA